MLQELERCTNGAVIVSSFDLATVDAVRDRGRYPTGWLVSRPFDAVEAARPAAGHGHAALHPQDRPVDARLLAETTALGLAVLVWTVDEPARQRALARFSDDSDGAT